jgi:hypothetical protein
MTSPSNRPLFPPAIDSTILAAFRSCPQKAFRTYVEHWKPQTESVHLVAGGAFAKGIEIARRAFFEGIYETPNIVYLRNETTGFEDRHVTWASAEGPLRDREAAEAMGLGALLATYGDFECPADSAKSLERTAGALEFYFERYPLGADGTEPIALPGGKRGIEFSFAEPLPIAHPVSGDPILYTGRADMIAEAYGGRYIYDEKTTSQLGASWPRQWEHRSQFTGYCWAAQQNNIPVNGAVVRGISILKTKYDTLETMTHRGQWEIDRWLEQVVRDVQRMIKCWEEGWWDYNLDHACAEYGGCSLQSVCKSPDPMTWLPMSFEQRVWDPLAKKEMTVAEWEKQWEGSLYLPS